MKRKETKGVVEVKGWLVTPLESDPSTQGGGQLPPLTRGEIWMTTKKT